MTNLYKIYPRLTSNEMDHVLEVFVKVVSRALTEATEGDALHINRWLDEVTLLKPTFILRPDSFAFLAQSLKNEVIQDFVFSIQFRFFATAGVEKEDFICSLIQNLVDGLCIDGPDMDYSALPVEVSESTSLAQYQNQKNGGWGYNLLKMFTGYKAPHYSLFLLLRNNAWLVVVLLMILVGKETEPVED